MEEREFLLAVNSLERRAGVEAGGREEQDHRPLVGEGNLMSPELDACAEEALTKALFPEFLPMGHVPDL
jgi:hypothetical protein